MSFSMTKVLSAMQYRRRLLWFDYIWIFSCDRDIALLLNTQMYCNALTQCCLLRWDLIPSEHQIFTNALYSNCCILPFCVPSPVGLGINRLYLNEGNETCRTQGEGNIWVSKQATIDPEKRLLLNIKFKQFPWPPKGILKFPRFTLIWVCTHIEKRAILAL